MDGREGGRKGDRKMIALLFVSPRKGQRNCVETIQSEPINRLLISLSKLSPPTHTSIINLQLPPYWINE